MELKDLIGHTIIDISDNVELLIKTDKGIYELNTSEFPDGSLHCVHIRQCEESTWGCFNGVDD